MSLTAGEHLGPYVIVSLIGKGGMGEVFRARDPRLGRDVAIKVSQEKFTERFEREARMIASLNHPNVCTLHDIGPDYLVMELIEGESPRGPLPLELALNYARQVASALDFAHTKGVIHRDLKPGNIKITPDGMVKVLDFGLAKVAQPSAADSENSPTLSMTATQPGVILGTAAYMAPEQVKGKLVDKRADIWAFGAVLYEMLTGERLFKGEDVSEILAGVIKEKPDLSAIPDKVRPLLERCLEKDPRQRLRDIGDFDLLLAPSPKAAPSGLRNLIASAIAAVAVIGFLAVSYVRFRESPPAPPALVKFEIAAPEKTTLRKFSVSPNGRMVAFNADSFEGVGGLWVRPIDSVESRRLAGADIDPPMFFWSPDSRYLAYPVSSKLMKVDVTGGPAEPICETKTLVIGGSWNPDGTIIFGVYQSGLWRVPATGGEPSPLTALDAARQEQNHVSPFFLPDGKHFLYLRISSVPANTGIYMGSLDTKPGEQSLKRLVASDFAPVYVPSSNNDSGYLMFAREGTVMVQTLDLTKSELTGEPVRIAEHINSEYEFGGFAASGNGVLAYRTGGEGGTNSVQLTWFDRKGNPDGATPPATYFDFSLSPDASSVAAHRLVTGINGDIWRWDFSRNSSTRLTTGSGDAFDPVWSPDALRVLYAANRPEGAGIYQRPSTGAGNEEMILPPHGIRDLNDLSRDGKTLLFSELNSKGKFELWTLAMMTGATSEARKPSLYLSSDFNQVEAQFSPNGQSIAYVSDETGRPEIYIQPFPLNERSGERITVSSNGGTMPRWRGNELFFIANGRQIMAADVTYAPSPKVGIPHMLFETTVAGVGGTLFIWDVASDGKRFLIPKLPSGQNAPQTPITVVLNWPSLLKK
jgi:eukaryotic-like serine/threonine-protein kinase